jgi:hypothetical protein
MPNCYGDRGIAKIPAMNATAAANHCRRFQFCIRQLLVLTLAIAVAVPIVCRVHERWISLQRSQPSKFGPAGVIVNPNREDVRGLSKIRDSRWVIQAFASDAVQNQVRMNFERATSPQVTLAAVGAVALADDAQDREQRNRIQLEKTLDVWDYPTAPQVPLFDGMQTIETIEYDRAETRPIELPAGGIPSSEIDHTWIHFAPATTIRERERLEWLRIQAGDGNRLVVHGDLDRERRKRIQLEKTLNYWDDPSILPALSPGGIRRLHVEGPSKDSQKLPPIRRCPRQPQRPPPH